MFTVCSSEEGVEDWGFLSTLGHTELFAEPSPYLATGGALTVKAEITFFVDDHPTITTNSLQIQSVTSTTKVELEAYLEKQGRLLGDEETADFMLISSDGKKFPVHRALLQAHSPMFAAMLTHGCEQASGQCIIPDIEGKVLTVLLKYIYSCDTSMIGEVVEPLLEAADKYQIVDLREKLVDPLAQNVNAENAVRLLVVADQRGLGALEKAALFFISTNADNVIEAGGLQQVAESTNGKELGKKIWCAISSQKFPGNQKRKKPG